MRPLKIANLHRTKGASYRLRCQAPLTWLQQQGAIELLSPFQAWEADIVLLHEQWQAGAMSIVRSLQRHGIMVAVDIDEDLLSIPDEHPFAPILGSWQGPAFEIIKAADAVLVPNDSLASGLSRFNSKIQVTPNGLDLNSWRQAVKPPERDRVCTVGFAAASTEWPSLERLRPVLAKLSYKFKEQGIRFVCFGFRPTWLADIIPDAAVVYAPDGTDYVSRFVGMGLDIALAPAWCRGFTESRSPLAFWEYSAAGAVTIASKVEPYASAIRHGCDGLLVDHDAASWTDAIWKLVRDGDLRRQLAEAARRSVEEHDIARTAPRLLEALEATTPNRDRKYFTMARTQAVEVAEIDIVIPIHNAPEFAREAIEATLPELNSSHRLVVVDDASDDPGIASLLEECGGHPWVTVHRNQVCHGFVGSCDLAVERLIRPEADMILMKQEVRPMPGFVRRLAQTAGSNPGIGTVTAVSNNGSIASVPDVSDAIRVGLDLDRDPLIAPTGVDHLMYIKREVLAKYGFFDLAFSPKGGEEVDFSLRISAEYGNVIDTGCWCRHTPPLAPKSKQMAERELFIQQRYPHYLFEVSSYLAKDPLLSHRVNMVSASRDPRPRVLHVLHSPEGGGTEKHLQDLTVALSGEFLSFKAAPWDTLKLYCGDVALGEWSYTPADWPISASNLPENDTAWLAILDRVKPDLIHFHHLLRHPLSLLAKLTATGIPVITSIHDYYFVCPDYTLQFCPGIHSCETCFPEQFKAPAEYQIARRALLGGSLRQSSALVAPSQFTADLVREVYPDLNIRVIPHGIREISRLPRVPSSKLRFGMIGTVSRVKGIEIITQAWPRVKHGGAAELHVYGDADPLFIQLCEKAGIHFHGAYREADLPEILAQIDIGVLPSQAPETFCYALSEFFAGGVPVVGSDYGALADRIFNGVNGLKVPRDNPQAWVDALSRLVQDGALREKIARGVMPPNRLDQMATRYSELYNEVLAKPAAARMQYEICSEQPVQVGA